MKHTCPRPAHNTAVLFGGPVVFTCPLGHDVYAADVPNEFRPAVTR
ncbi:hypothetical protein [Microbispora sp. KK1-11]|nr:hypothetical protein [Microbispora sp. KK1-11]